MTLLNLNIVLNGLNFKTHLRHNEKQGTGRFRGFHSASIYRWQLSRNAETNEGYSAASGTQI